MEISINGNSITYKLDEETTLGQVLGSLESECEKNSMTITSIAVDGEIVSPANLDVLFNKSPDDISTIELKTMNGDDIIDVLHRIGERMAAQVTALTEIPVLLQTGDDPRVLEIIHGFAQDFESLCQSLPLVKTITDKDISTAQIDGIPLEQYPAELTPLLGELVEAMKSNDTVLIGDISEYELAPKVKELAIVLSTV